MNDREPAGGSLLYRFDDVARLADSETLAGLDEAETRVAREIAAWSRQYLTNPHPNLGRSGDVCPWVATSIRESCFYLAVIRRPQDDPGTAEAQLVDLGEKLLALEPSRPRQAQFKTIVVVFTGLPEVLWRDVVLGLHRRLKPSFVDRGLMLGEFFGGYEKPGLHNPAFRPLQSPHPLIVIRSMVPNDIVFLYETKRFAQAFVRAFRFIGIDELALFLERNREKLSSEQIGVLLEVLMDAGLPIGRRWREIDATSGALTLECLLRHFDARLADHAGEVLAPAWIALRIENAAEIRERLGPGAVAFVVTEVFRIARRVIGSASQLAHCGEWFAIVVWSADDEDVAALTEQLCAELQQAGFAYQGTGFAARIRLGHARSGGAPRAVGMPLTARDWLREVQQQVADKGRLLESS